MALNIGSLLDAVISHASASGWFDQVNGHEPLHPSPTGGITAGVWVDRITPIRASGLDSVSAVVTFQMMLYQSTQMQPLDALDPHMVQAVDALCTAYCGDFTLGGQARAVDVLGAYGQGLDVRAGYLMQDGTRQRVMTISLPVIVNDLWTEAP